MKNNPPLTTYLMGAGASCATLPLGSNLGIEIGESADSIRNEIEKFYGKPGLPYKDEERPWPRGPVAKHIIEDFEWLADRVADTTVDNFARKLSVRVQSGELSARNDLNRLKNALVGYFLFIQSRKKLDVRYDEFFGKILKLEERIDIPGYLKIITWNYDVLLERSYYGCVQSKDRVKESITQSPNIVRLNGIAGVVKPFNTTIFTRKYYPFGFVEAIYQDREPLPIDSIIKLYDSFYADPSRRLMPEINFAWETEGRASIEKARECIAGTESLVVIGYSFPDFNRDVDQLLLQSISTTVREISVQAPNEPSNNHKVLRYRLAEFIGQDTFKQLEDAGNISFIDSKGWFHRPRYLVP